MGSRLSGNIGLGTRLFMEWKSKPFMIIIIQARSNSKRFPGKIYQKVNGKPLIEYAIDAAKETKINFCVVIPKGDLKLIEYLETRQILYFEGSELDVLDRFYQYVQYSEHSPIIRLCADTLYDKEDILEQIKLYQKRNKFTYGNGVYICSFSELKDAWANAKGNHREHVTTYLYRSIDYPEDIEKWQKE